jgi:serine/threonine protein kinase
MPTRGIFYNGMSSADENNPLIGAVIRDRYEVTEVIGRGAMGVVYKARQLDDDRPVAIKFLHGHLTQNPESLKRFKQEAMAARGLMHPNIVRLYEVEIGPGGLPYIAMEFVEGTTLADYMREKKFLTTMEALPIIRQVCEALAEAHSQGVLHRDVKPANIMLMNRFGQENFVVVLDFSIAKVVQRASDAATTTPGLIFGSPAYMSPERFMGRGGDFRSDIYSVGIIMFQMLAGRAPFKSSDLYTLMNEHIGTPVPRVKSFQPQSDIPDQLEEIIQRALAKKEKDRQENVKQLLAEVDEVYRMLKQGKSSSAEIPAIVVGTTYGGNGSGEQPTASVAAQAQAQAQSHSSGRISNVFDINPGITPGGSIPAFSAEQRKSLEESIGAAGAYPKNPVNEAAVSGIWSKAVANRAGKITQTSGKVATVTKPQHTQPKFSGKLAALIAVGIFGVGSVLFVAFQNSGAEGNIEQKIATGSLTDASSMMETWHSGIKPGDEEKFAGLALSLAKAYYERHDTLESGRWLEQVPDTSKFSPEAKRLLKALKK